MVAYIREIFTITLASSTFSIGVFILVIWTQGIVASICSQAFLNASRKACFFNYFTLQERVIYISPSIHDNYFLPCPLVDITIFQRKKMFAIFIFISA